MFLMEISGGRAFPVAYQKIVKLHSIALCLCSARSALLSLLSALSVIKVEISIILRHNSRYNYVIYTHNSRWNPSLIRLMMQ
jgi:hypothetical protein